MQDLAGQPPTIRRYISGLILQGGLGIARPGIDIHNWLISHRIIIYLLY
jgi:hypothetical protein